MRFLVSIFAILLAGCGARSSVDVGASAGAGTAGAAGGPPSTPHVYFAESAVHGDDGRIVRVDDLSGAGWTSFPVLSLYPCNVVVDPKQRIYFVTGSPPAVVRMNDMLGAGLTTFSNPGPGAGQIQSPGALALDAAGRIYVTDTLANRVVRMDDIDGSGWVSLGGLLPGSGAGAFNSPSGIAVSASGKILISDNGNRRVVQVDDISGAGWQALDIPAGPMGPPYTQGVSYDSAGRIYVVDFSSSLLHRFADIGGGDHAIFGPANIVQISHVFAAEDDRLYLGMINYSNTVAVMDDMTGAGFETLSVPEGEKPLRNPCSVYVR